MEDFIEEVADRLAEMPGVEAVALGGSRAQGTARPDSDWDLGVYYRAGFDPRSIRDAGWPGQVFGLGEWGGGVFNGGAWLRIDGRPVDIHYRNLTVVEEEFERAGRGEFDIQPLMFHLAGIPTYLVVAELAVNRVLRGALPKIDGYPHPLRRAAGGQWLSRAEMHVGYAEKNYGLSLQGVGLAAVASIELAHARAAYEGRWVTNEKRLLTDEPEVTSDLLPELRNAISHIKMLFSNNENGA